MSTLASVIVRDTLANRPAASIAGRLFYDTTNSQLQRDNGSSWDSIEGTTGGTPVGDHGWRVNKSAAQTINDATVTAITFDQERWDTDAYHDTSSNTDRATIPSGQAGKYLIGGSVEFASNSSGFRDVRIYLNGTGGTILGIQRVVPNSTSTHQISISLVYNLSVGDYVVLAVFQNRGGTLNVNASGNYSPEFWGQRLA